MSEQLVKYFIAEKNAGLVFVGLASLAIGISVLLFKVASPYRMMAIPLVAVAAIQLAVGTAVYFRTDRQAATLAAQLEENPAAFKSEELTRMDKVMEGFHLFKAVEIVLFAVGLGMTYLFRSRVHLHSVGMGLLVQASATLVVDLMAERRADRYVGAIQELHVPADKPVKKGQTAAGDAPATGDRKGGALPVKPDAGPSAERKPDTSGSAPPSKASDR